MKRKILKVIIRNIILITLLISYYLLYKYTGIGIPCPIHKLTGYLCPGCGITRVLFSLIEFNITKAFNYNPLVCIYLPFILAYFIYLDYLYIYNKKDKIINKIPNFIWYILIIITIIFGIIRNIY